MLMKRILVALLLIPISLYVLTQRDIVVFLILEAIVLIMVVEYYTMIAKISNIKNRLLGALFSLIIPASYYFTPNRYRGDVVLSVISLMLIVLVVNAILKRGAEAALQNISYTLFGALYFSLLSTYMLAIALLDNRVTILSWIGELRVGRLWLILVFALAAGADSAAYMIGKYFGRVPLAKNISPKKTIEGFIAAIIFGFIVGIFLHRVEIFNLTLLKSLILSTVSALISQLGDLGASVIKRECGVKDSGRLLLSHGGVIDRCDSILFVAPFVFYFIKLFV